MKKPAAETKNGPIRRKRDPARVDHLLKTAVAHHRVGQLSQAETLYRELLQDSPDHADGAHLLGVLTCQAGNYAAGLEFIDKAIRRKPGFAAAYSNRGIALQRLGQYQAAMESFDKAILLQADFADAYKNRGDALNENQQYQAAVESFDKAILYRPDHAEAYCNRGNAFLALQQYPSAKESFEQVIRIRPDAQEAYYNRGIALYGLQQYEAAVESFDQAIHIKPDFAEAYGNRGITYYAMQQYQSALDSFAKALLLKPKHEYLLGMQIRTKQLVCFWEDLEGQCQDLEARIDRNEKVAPPFTVLFISGSPALQRKAAEIYSGDKYPSPATITVIPLRPRRDRIRIGYYSADFYDHPTCYLMAELFERHDRTRFELVAFSFGQHNDDEMRGRVTAAMDRFLDVRSLSDRAIAQLSRELEVDIAVDLKGFTEHSRMGLFAQRAAPIQVNYLGYPGTTGAAFMDYLIADHTLIPEASRRHYSEKIVSLPDSYQVNDSTRPISTRPYVRGEQGLPEQGFVYCCFNNSSKITPATFDQWMRILGRVKGSVLWLLEGNSWMADNLRQEAARRGISPQRLIFARHLPPAEHLARHRLADLFLDNLPCNAHTTASDALWTGLPVLTCMGEAFAGRVAGSLLRAIDLPELVTTTEPAYEALAIELALNAARYQEIRERLRRNRLTAALFDVPSFTRNLETAYITMYERYQAALLPDHIDIARVPSSTSGL